MSDKLQEVVEDNDDLDEAIIVDDTEIDGESTEEDEAPVRYNLSSYGWDIDVDGVVKRLKRDDIHIPPFQRGFVWKRAEMSRFIESLILGIPIPSIFLSKDVATQKFNVIDGQQRLTTLKKYLNGEFSLYADDIQEDLKKKYFSSEVKRTKNVLSEEDQRALSDAILRTIVITPDPADDDPNQGHNYNTAILQIFKRLNSSGKPLQAQEIRSCVFHGTLNNLLGDLNTNAHWRACFGPTHTRLKDMEIILRCIALLENGEHYSSPMPKFLNNFMETQRHMGEAKVSQLKSEFEQCLDLCMEAYGPDVFKQGASFLLTKCEAVLIGTIAAFRSGKTFTVEEFKSCVEELLADDSENGYQWSVDEFVNDTNRVTARRNISIRIFGS